MTARQFITGFAGFVGELARFFWGQLVLGWRFALGWVVAMATFYILLRGNHIYWFSLFVIGFVWYYIHDAWPEQEKKAFAFLGKWGGKGWEFILWPVLSWIGIKIRNVYTGVYGKKWCWFMWLFTIAAICLLAVFRFDLFPGFQGWIQLTGFASAGAAFCVAVSNWVPFPNYFG